MGSVVTPILVVIFLIIFAVGGYVVAQGLSAWKDQLNNSLKERNIDISRGGLKVGVRNISDEAILDKLQRGMVKTLSNSHITPAAQTKQSFFMRRFVGAPSKAEVQERKE